MRRRGLTWRTKLLALMIVFAVAPVTAVAYSSYSTLVDTFHESTLAGLRGLAQAKAEALDLVTESRKRDVERIAHLMAPHVERVRVAERERDAAQPLRDPPPELPELEDAEALGTNGEPDARTVDPPVIEPPGQGLPPAAEDEAVAEAMLRLRRALGSLLWDRREFEELLLIDMTGRVVASTWGEHEGRSAASLDYFIRGRKATFIQPVFHSPITGELTMVISTPMRGENHEEIGVLAARLNLRRFFRLITDSTGLGETGETVVAGNVGDEIVFMAPTRHDAKAALERKLAVGSARQRGLQESTRGQNGDGVEEDYRGVLTFQAWQHVPSLDWGLVVKFDHDEAVRGLAAARQRTVAFTLVILVLVAVASVVAAQALVRPLRELKDATDRISRGDFAVALDIRSNDEFGELADSFERMVAAIKFFREHSRSADEDEDEGEGEDEGERGGQGAHPEDRS
jgi:HAMP domain-containing protein